MSKHVRLGLLGLACFVLGALLAPELPYVRGQQATKGPNWMYGLDLRVRKGGQKDFDKDTPKFGVEVFRDENNNNLVYISETGSIAVVPAK